MNKNFSVALDFVLKWEGGYSNDPNDPGGETNFGISKRSYPNEDIKNMTKERAIKIYYENYWLKQKCNELPFPINFCVFNCGVNCGRATAKSLYLASKGNWKDFLLRQIEYYANLEGAKYYLRGWINRTISLFNVIKEEDS